MSFTLIILGLVVGGILALVAIIFGVITLAQGKQKNALIWGIVFLITISIVIVSIVQLVKRLGEKVVDGVEWVKEQEAKQYTGENDFSKMERQNWLDTLQKYTSERSAQNMPADHYKNEAVTPDANGNQVLPFVYPLSIKYNSTSYLGDIINDATDSVYLQNVSQMAFDENFVIARVDNTLSKDLLKEGRAEIEYVLFDMRTREFLSFNNQEQLLDKSAKIGYTGPQELRYLSDDFRGWIEYPEYE